MCGDHTRTITDFIHELGGKQIDQKLHAEIHRDHRADERERNPVLRIKRYKEQRSEIIDDRLRNVTDITGYKSMSDA